MSIRRILAAGGVAIAFAAMEMPAISAKTSKPAAPAPADARANPLLNGNQSPPLPAGPSGKVAVIASGSLTTMIPKEASSSFDLPVVVRNNTTKARVGIQVSATARDSSGTLIGVGDSQLGTEPLRVPPGQIAIGHVFFQNKPPADASVTFKVSTSSSTGKVSVMVVESNVTPVPGGFADMIGQVKNQTSKSITSSPLVVGLCFSQAGQPTAVAATSAHVDGALAPGAMAAFSSQIFGSNSDCPIWLVGALGFTF